MEKRDQERLNLREQKELTVGPELEDGGKLLVFLVCCEGFCLCGGLVHKVYLIIKV